MILLLCLLTPCWFCRAGSWNSVTGPRRLTTLLFLLWRFQRLLSETLFSLCEPVSAWVSSDWHPVSSYLWKMCSHCCLAAFGFVSMTNFAAVWQGVWSLNESSRKPLSYHNSFYPDVSIPPHARKAAMLEKLYQLIHQNLMMLIVPLNLLVLRNFIGHV